MHTISDREKEKAVIAREYIRKIESRVQKRLDKYQEEHEQGFIDNSKKISALELELSILSYLKAPCKEKISIYLEEKRSEPTEEELKAQWLRDNGEVTNDPS